MSTKISLFVLLISSIHSMNKKNYDTALLMLIVTFTSILFHYNLYENARFFDVIISQTIVFYYFFKWLYYKCWQIDRLAISFWILGICLYMLGVHFNSNFYHSLMHLSFASASILLHCIIKDKLCDIIVNKKLKKKLEKKLKKNKEKRKNKKRIK